MPPSSKTDYRFECKGGVATIYIYGVIDRWEISAKQIADDIEAAGKVSRLRVRINSEGGDVFQGLAIYNILRDHSAKVEIYVDGMALSIASLIVMAGDTRIMAENAYLCVHDPVGSVYAGDSDELRRMAELVDSLQDTLAETYAKRTGQTTSKILELMAAETWLTADKAVELGFADSAGESMKVAAHVDARKFLHVPKSLIANQKEPIMAESDKTTPDATPKAPVVASFKDLEAGLPGADSDFLIAQMKAEATLPQAQSAWMAEQSKRLGTAKKEAEVLAKATAKKAEEDKAAAGKPGLKVEGEGTGGDGDGDAAFGGDPIVEWNKRLAAKVDAGMPRAQATSRLNREVPGLREAYVEAYNAQHGVTA